MSRKTEGLGDLSLLQRSLLEKLLKKKQGEPSEGGTIPRRQGDGPLHLSFAQQRLWFLHQLEPESPAYNIFGGARIRGELDLPTFQRCLEEIVRRHESLRTTFPSEHGEPAQVVHKECKLGFKTVDLQGLPAEERETEALRLAEEEAGKPFNLVTGPLFRSTLLRLGQREHLLISVIHHIVYDAWSGGVFMGELSRLYEAYRSGQPSPLPAMPIQYADFAAWQRKWMQSDGQQKQLDYWKRQLADLPVFDMPSDHPRPPVPSSRGAKEPLSLPAGLVRALKEFSRRENTTLFMTLLAAFKTLLYRYADQDHAIVGIPIAGRNRAETEGLIGFFVNTLVLRSDMGGDPTFREFLTRIRETTLEAYANQDVPFEKLVEELRPVRDASRSPLFQIMFVFQNVPAVTARLGEVEITPYEIDPVASKFDLTLKMAEQGEEVLGALHYRTDLFKPATIERMAAHFRNILEGIIADPDRRLGDLPLLDPAEKDLLLREWNSTEHEYPRNECIHQVIEHQAGRTPDAAAVVLGADSLTYRELNIRSNQLARFLKRRGVGPDVIVGVCLERSIDMIVGLLAILKAGGAYLPLDALYPKSRLAMLLEETGARLMLTQEALLGRLPEFSGEIVCLDQIRDLLQREDRANPAPAATQENLVYVVFTSGSTGKPKGVMTTHQNVAQHLDFVIREYQLQESDVVVQIPSYTSDASVRDIFAPLMVGARVVLLPPEGAKDPSVLARTIREARVTCVLSIVPNYLKELLREASRLKYRPGLLRLIIVGGDLLPMSSARQAREIFGCQAVSQYGPTECTLISTYHRVSELDAHRDHALVGRPIANAKFYVLDRRRNLMPIGVPGEAYIGGPGVALGYLKQPELTADRFIPNHFSDDSGERLYKTGDRVRYLPDGTLEFLGRTDNQFKVRGFRIEPGEIETAMNRHPAVEQSLVVGEDDASGDKRLVAYIIRRGERAPTAGELRTFLAGTLPDHMVPTAFMLIDKFPRTATGKVDRRASLTPIESLSLRGQKHLSPRNHVERVICSAWSEILEVDHVGVHDDFFELGGHSLSATRLIARMREVTSLDLPLRLIFQAPTVAGIAEKIHFDESTGEFSHQEVVSEWKSFVPMRPGGSRPPLYLLAGAPHANEAEFLRYLSNLIPHLGLDQPIYGFRPRGLSSDEKPHTCVKEMAHDYLKDLRAFQPKGPYYLGGECIGGIVAFEMAQQLLRDGETVGILVLMDTTRPSAKRAFRQRLRYYFRRIHHISWHLRSVFRLNVVEGGRHLARLLRSKFPTMFPVTSEGRKIRRSRTVEVNYPRILYQYRPQKYPGPITLMVNEEAHLSDPTMGWQDIAEGGLDIQIVPGNHITRLTVHGKITAERLQACLDRAQAGYSD